MMSYQNDIPQLRFSGFDGKWKQRRLGEVSNFLDGRRKPIKSEDRSKMKGEYPYYGASGIIDYVNNYIFDEELILLGEDGENIISRNSPLAFRVSGKCWINNHAHVIVPKDNTNIDFLTHNLERINYVVYNTGTAQPKLNQEVCRNIPSWFPTLAEQQKIASFLIAVDEKIQQLSRKKELLEQYKKGVIQQLFSGKLRFKDENGKDYADWDEKKLSTIMSERNDQAPKSEQYPLMAFIQNIGVAPKGERYNREFLVNDENGKKYKKTEFGDFIYSSNNLETGSIGLNRYGSASISPVYSIFNIKELCDFQFICSFLVRKSFINKMISFRQGVVYGQWRIHESDFLMILEKFPCLEEQQKIANFLSSIDAKIESTNQQITKTQSFKKGLLQQMFV